MPLIDTNHQRAALLVLLLGVALVIALTPYATGLIGIPVLYAVFTPVHEWLSLRVRPKIAASLVVALALFLIVVPGVSFAGLIVGQAQEIATGVIRNPLLGRLRELRLGGIDLGPRLADLAATVVAWIGSSAFGLVTTATIVGTGLTAAIQGSLVGLGFWLTGLPNAVFWGVVTMVFAILPVVGSGLVWGPGALALMIGGHALAGMLLALGGVVIVGNVDYVIRPRVFSRWANIHPLITLIGALAGVPYFGILGLLIGPLALSYFFELIKMYGEEYLE